MIPEEYIIKDDEGNEVVKITNKDGKFTIELDENYSIETTE